AEIRRFFFGGPSRWMLVYETPKNVPETLKDRRAGSPGRRLSLHSKKLHLTWSANHLVRSGTSDHFPCVLGVLNFNTSTLQHLNPPSGVTCFPYATLFQTRGDTEIFFWGTIKMDACVRNTQECT